MRVIPVIVSIETNVDQVTVFDHIVPIDLTKIFTGYGPLPAVIGTQHQTGAWDAAAQTRTVLLSDDSSAQEQLTGYDHPHYFSYTVSGFTGILRHLAISADGNGGSRRTRAKQSFAGVMHSTPNPHLQHQFCGLLQKDSGKGI
ncbi:hypothetical protein [Aquirhabdus sp.]|uniref:hypothetical protein n=1 Tax=Aquirhabdus sp. TaxID=2824160 RepID=UPI00396C8D22